MGAGLNRDRPLEAPEESRPFLESNLDIVVT